MSTIILRSFYEVDQRYDIESKCQTKMMLCWQQLRVEGRHPHTSLVSALSWSCREVTFQHLDYFDISQRTYVFIKSSTYVKLQMLLDLRSAGWKIDLNFKFQLHTISTLCAADHYSTVTAFAHCTTKLQRPRVGVQLHQRMKASSRRGCLGEVAAVWGKYDILSSVVCVLNPEY